LSRFCVGKILTVVKFHSSDYFVTWQFKVKITVWHLINVDFNVADSFHFEETWLPRHRSLSETRHCICCLSNFLLAWILSTYRLSFIIWITVNCAYENVVCVHSACLNLYCKKTGILDVMKLLETLYCLKWILFQVVRDQRLWGILFLLVCLMLDHERKAHYNWNLLNRFRYIFRILLR
jgi:hypothetical protein